MAFVVEDGVGRADANSFASVTQFRQYHTDRGTSTSSLTDTVVQGLLVKATDFLSNSYNYGGVRMNPVQRLAFPRDALARNDDRRIVLGIPTELVEACCDLALVASTRELAPAPKAVDGNRNIVSEEKEIGPLRKKVEYGSGGVGSRVPQYPNVEMLLAPFIVSGGAWGSMLIRC